MDLSLPTVLSITTGYLHSSFINLDNAVCGITGKTYFLDGLVMNGIPLVKEHIIKFFPQFANYERIDFPNGSYPTKEQIEKARIELELPSSILTIPKIDLHDSGYELKEDIYLTRR